MEDYDYEFAHEVGRRIAAMTPEEIKMWSPAKKYSEAIQNLLTQYGEVIGEDLSNHVVYGSPMRPMSSSWARIPDAVFMQSDKQSTGYHTFVAVPVVLGQEVVDRYELTIM